MKDVCTRLFGAVGIIIGRNSGDNLLPFCNSNVYFYRSRETGIVGFDFQEDIDAFLKNGGGGKNSKCCHARIEKFCSLDLWAWKKIFRNLI